jgi:hypothetical protein
MTRIEVFNHRIANSTAGKSDACKAVALAAISPVTAKNNSLSDTDAVHFRKCNLLDGNS